MSNPKKVAASSGNVFADLGFGNPEEELFKAKLVRENRGIIKRRKLTQTKGCCHARSQAAGRQHSGAMRSSEPGISRFRVCA